jgi:hypothetical protein
MAYSEKAKDLRRCTQVRPDGRRCRGWAVWGDDRRLCRRHGGRHPTKPWPSEKTTPVKCTCPAYAWPHRPGGGLCRWPDPPLYRRATKAGTHARYRVRVPRCVKALGWKSESQPPVWQRT